ncbi:hypothetical protein B1C78_14320 [Thioalkalivibrio denitrificans]|uniref:Cytochrome c-552/DMSO reductase-like haem-binding domain-containing protein n=2 Tax=Thioalkalivibrio denitrificans TaxID=108003 RepID=A0A1V3NCF4_9GAMM|nr:hypothetical protein B1C78_14320 [Thioalkalivibrio denitrificans]
MMPRTLSKLLITALFAAGLLLSLMTHGTGVITHDPERNIWIPDELTMPLRLQVAYNDEDILFRYRWPQDEPHLYLDVLRYSDGQWVRYGTSPVGPDPHGIYEDRVTMLVDDGSVPEFSRYGGYLTVGDGMRFFTNAATREEIAAHPVLGPERRSDIRKHLPATRSDPGDWRTLVDEDTLAAQRRAGYFLDLWHWRAHRSNPIDVSDDQFVAQYRFGDSGRGPYFTNWDGETRQPRLMFDPDAVGKHALRWEDVSHNIADFDGIYYLAEDFAVPFDPDHAWQEGDVIPRRVLREPAGSRGDIRVDGKGRFADGQWDVTLRRALDTGNPQEDKIMHDGGVYDVGIAVHRHGTGSRWHYVSMPYQVGLGRKAEIQATRFEGDSPDWDQIATYDITLFYPGQVNWPRLNSEIHAGAEYIRQGVPVKFRHNEAQLAQYGVEIEFEQEIRRQWFLTLLLGVALIISFVMSASLLLGRKEED